MKKDQLIFGAAYYDEYMPCERLEKDMQMMVAAGINTIRIAESTWSVEEPEPGKYDFSSVDRVIDMAARYGIQVIVGTPTYAVPYWLVQLDPEVMVMTKDGRRPYGARQAMDITNPTYRYYAERIIRALISHTAPRENVIGFQLDNETKHYGVSGQKATAMFQKWLAEQFDTTTDLNEAFGFNYWSNSVTRFEDLPDPVGTINGSYGTAYTKFQRHLVTEFLMWQSEIVKEYMRPDQFITHNFDYEWRFFGAPGEQEGYSCGIQPDNDHWDSSKAVTMMGTDIYCFCQDRLTGREIAFGGDLMRPVKNDNYLVLESQAQAFADWLPYPGQLRLMAYSHIASGANGVMYWHWHSIHNSKESYWKGILSHDFESNPTYEEVGVIGNELKTLSPKLMGMRKQNRIAMVVSTDVLSALRWFPVDKDLSYNDILHWVYDALFELNLECDIIFEQQEDWSPYDMVVIPALYSIRDGLDARVRRFVENGGTVVTTFKSFVADKHVKIFHDKLPHGLTDVFGMTYNQFTRPICRPDDRLTQPDALTGDRENGIHGTTVEGKEIFHWMELLNVTTAQPVAHYEHRFWGKYAAVTRNDYGKGHAWYIGAMLSSELLKKYLLAAVQDAGISAPAQQYPIVLRDGISREGRKLHFILNYAQQEIVYDNPYEGTMLLAGMKEDVGMSMNRKEDAGVPAGMKVTAGQQIKLAENEVLIIEEA